MGSAPRAPRPAPARFDPRAIAVAATLATALLLTGTSWPLLGAVAAWLAIAWVAARADPRAIPLGAALAVLLAGSALVGSLIAGLGVDEALRRGLRALLLVAVATWLRAAARPSGLREVFRRVLHRLRRVPATREAGTILDALDPSPGRLLAAGRALAGRLAGVHKRPAPIADAVIAWVAGEAAGYRSRHGAPVRAAIEVRARDAALVALAALPALALLPG